MFIATLFTAAQKVETTQVCIDKWIDKQNAECMYLKWNIIQP